MTAIKMTDKEISEGYLTSAGRPITEGDLDAFKRMVLRFGCEDAASYKEAKDHIRMVLEKISSSMEMDV